MALAALAAGCARVERPAVVATWVVGQAAPEFDPQGPPDPVRWAIERLLSRGLVEEDSLGSVVPAAAESVIVSPDSLTYTFRLRPDLAFSDGSPCRSADFRRVLEAGANRLDHASYAWLMAAVQGMDQVRAGRPLPALGIATPNDRTLVLRLARPDTSLLRKLALPGASTPWRDGAGWRDGIGDYTVAIAAPNRLTLARRAALAGEPDTLVIRFVAEAARVRALLRAKLPDLVWPLPPDLLDLQLPAQYQPRVRAARPARRLMLVLRMDLPPTTKVEARQAFAHGVNQDEVIAQLGQAGAQPGEWLPGAGAFEVPLPDPGAVKEWLERGRLGRSLHLVMVYSADGAAARVARRMQSEWARNGLDVELRPIRQPKVSAEMRKLGGGQLLLAETQPLLATPAAELAALVLPMRGPAVGTFRAGWRTREFDRWISGAAAAPLDVVGVQQRLADEAIALPIADLPWLWAQRPEAAGRFHPRYGPDPRGFLPPLPEAR